MNDIGQAKRVRIYVTEGDRIGVKPAHQALVEHLRRANARGATVIRAVEGFGASGRIHVNRALDADPRLPLIVEWVDDPEAVARILPAVKELVPRSLITAEAVTILQGERRAVRELPDALTAGDVMTRDVVAVTPATPLPEVVELLVGKRYRAVPVLVDGLPAGIITNSDLVERGGLGVRVDLLPSLESAELRETLERLAATRRTAGDVMTREPYHVAVNTRLPRVAETMQQRRVKRLPVVDGRGKLVGMVSRVDLLRIAGGGAPEPAELPAEAPGFDGDVPIARLMRRDVPTVDVGAGVGEVCQAIVSTRLHRTLVVDERGRLVGEITDARLLERLGPALRPRALGTLMGGESFAGDGEGPCAADLMVGDVATVDEDTPLGAAIGRMLAGSHKVVAVLDRAGRIAGIADRADLLRGLVPR